MLISLKHKFIFVANVKTASTAIEEALCDRCQIVLDRSEWGKHASLSHIEKTFSGLFESVPRQQFVVFGVMREPVDWLYSLYRSHKSIQFEGSAIDTAGMSFSTFLTTWCEQNHSQVRDQHLLFEDSGGQFGADYILRYDHLDEDFARLMQMLGVESCPLTHRNVSVEPSPFDLVTPEQVVAIRDRYHTDREILMRRGGVPASSIRVETLSAEDSLIPDDTVDDTCAEHDGGEWQEKSVLRPITRDDVTWAFRMLLGRDPESERTIESHLLCRSREELRIRVMKSEEFKTVLRISQRE